jgi:hypothetical protein
VNGVLSRGPLAAGIPGFASAASLLKRVIPSPAAQDATMRSRSSRLNHVRSTGSTDSLLLVLL